MPYVTSVERLAKAEGLTEGRLEGRSEGRSEGLGLLLRTVGKRCGHLPAELEQQVRGLPFPRLETLSEDLLDFESAEDLRRWLESHSTAQKKRGRSGKARG